MVKNEVLETNLMDCKTNNKNLLQEKKIFEKNYLEEKKKLKNMIIDLKDQNKEFSEKIKNFTDRNKILITENKSLLVFKNLKEKEIQNLTEEKKTILDVIKTIKKFPANINWEKMFFFVIDFTKMLKSLKNKFILQLNEENDIFNKMTKILTKLIELINNGINNFNLSFKIIYGDNLENYVLKEKNFDAIMEKKNDIFIFLEKIILFFENLSKKLVF